MSPGCAETDRPVTDVSVVIPVYNHARFVRAAIESVLSQVVRPREIICIDDGSTDGSARVVEALASQHPSVRFRSRPNQGAHRTINEGIVAARGRYVAILNDLYHPERLIRCLAVLEAGPGAAVVATQIALVNGEGNAIRYLVRGDIRLLRAHRRPRPRAGERELPHDHVEHRRPPGSI
jgi:glycosyltransferase involved in cell wall biosynthesis